MKISILLVVAYATAVITTPVCAADKGAFTILSARVDSSTGRVHVRYKVVDPSGIIRKCDEVIKATDGVATVRVQSGYTEERFLQFESGERKCTPEYTHGG